ncbi:hypothetical protein V8G54_000737 [Vigna mungo]|uniref:Uncharacterized protein n=1 Tax=Vigna mungo TaxID=3915 RepID=A0AAQ3P981_VIGMU
MANPHEESPSTVQITRNITRQQLEELIPLQWVTNYEKLHENKKPLHTSEATFRRSVDGTVKTIFKQRSTSSSQIFQSMMIRPVIKERKILICGEFILMESPYSQIKSMVISYGILILLCVTQIVNATKMMIAPMMTTNMRKIRIQAMKTTVDHFLLPGEDLIPTLNHGLAYINPKNHILCGFRKDVYPSVTDPLFIISYYNYEQKFPYLERTIDPTTRINIEPNISPSKMGPNGRSKPLTQAEEVLNWQT